MHNHLCFQFFQNDFFTLKNCLHKIVDVNQNQITEVKRRKLAQWCNAILEGKREMLHVGPITSQWTLISSTNFVDCFPKRTNFEKPINFNFWPAAANLGGGWDGDAFSLVFWVNWQYTLYIAPYIKLGIQTLETKNVNQKNEEITFASREDFYLLSKGVTMGFFRWDKDYVGYNLPPPDWDMINISDNLGKMSNLLLHSYLGQDSNSNFTKAFWF